MINFFDYFQQPQSPTISDQTCDDSIIVNLKFHAITKSPPPKQRSVAQSCGNEISEVTIKGVMESSSNQVSAFDYLTEEDEADQLGLPISDYMSKVRHFLRTAQPSKLDVIFLLFLRVNFHSYFMWQDDIAEEDV
jgi:hypothetical protein